MGVSYLLVLWCASLLHAAQGQVTSCADTDAPPGMVRCVAWQEENGQCIQNFVSRFMINEAGNTIFLSTPGYPSNYPLGQTCTWNIVNDDRCTSLDFYILQKNFHKDDADGSNCRTSDHLEVDGGREIFCGGPTVQNCFINNCLSGAPLRRDSGNLIVKFRSDMSGSAAGAFGMVFRVDNGQCAGRKKRTNNNFEFYHVPKTPYCKHYYGHSASYYAAHYYHHYYYPPLCICFGTCTVHKDQIRATLLKIVEDPTGKKALKYVNSPKKILRNAARMTLKNIQNFNRTILTFEDLSNMQCTAPATSAPLIFPTTSAPKYTHPPIHRTHPTQHPHRTYRPPVTNKRPTYPTAHPWRPTHRVYTSTRSTPHPWTRSTKGHYYTHAPTPSNRRLPAPQPRYPNPYGYRG